MNSFEDILNNLPNLCAKAEELRSIVLSNLVMFSEIPSPTFGEDNRIEFLRQRFCESGISNISTDEVGNGLALIPGQDPQKNILLVAHADTLSAATEDHTLTLKTESAIGRGVADNSLGLAVLASVPQILDTMGIKLNSGLILMGGVRSLGKGNLEGLDFFLDNNKLPISNAICIEGVQLGRISYSSIGMLRAEITCKVPETYDWTRFGSTSAVLTMNEIINRINQIALPRSPKTSIVLGSVHGGSGFSVISTKAVLRLEIRSESAEMVEQIKQEIENNLSELSSTSGSILHFHEIARRYPGGLNFAHPLVSNIRSILHKLEIKDRAAPSLSELSALISHDVAAVTLGVTKGENLTEESESVEIEPISKGLAQLIGTILAIDGGFCNED